MIHDKQNPKGRGRLVVDDCGAEKETFLARWHAIAESFGLGFFLLFFSLFFSLGFLVVAGIGWALWGFWDTGTLIQLFP